jgi:transposase
MVRRVVAADWSLTQAAEAAGVSERTASKWVARYRREGEVGLADRSSAPKTLANRTDESRIETIAALRRLRMTGAEIAECLEMTLSTSLRGPGPNRLGQAQPARAARACEPL